ncbi:MAG: large subunit ribosomal protein L23Ae [Candidatus Diapherotrites archaeon]|nr:large subunit ribosomal protein L23Ae [Candidatus Diapherotrites archaeon]MDN5366922.1 large subunit ribosomal protein L23Ae [Candidatus Diapherotrites archaeon]
MDAEEIILYPLISEKAIAQIHNNNTIVFIVRSDATKQQIKKAVEDLYDVKVQDVNTLLARDGRKKAYVRLAEGYSALDLATKLGVI